MPVEVRELIIKAVIDEQTTVKKKDIADAQRYDRDEIVADCVDQVMEILRNKSER